MSMRSAPARTRGFTIVELMVTVMVATILMVIAVPSFNSVIANNRLTTQTNDLIAAMNFARSSAIKRNGSVILCRVSDATDTTCETGPNQWQHWVVRTSNGIILRRGVINTYGNKVRVRSQLTNDIIDFRSDGLARLSSGVLIPSADACGSTNCIQICTTSIGSNNRRNVLLGRGSRVSTSIATGTCT